MPDLTVDFRSEAMVLIEPYMNSQVILDRFDLIYLGANFVGILEINGTKRVGRQL